jgi:adenylate cyclase
MASPKDILRGRILIVDDQEANVELLRQMLVKAGYASISSTTDPTKVCELQLLHNFDLIILDLQMPGMDGFQVMENLKEIETGGYLPVLVVTAQPNHKLRALNSGARDFVSKPFDLAEVLIRVHNLLEVRLLHMETRRLYDRILAEKKVSERLLLQAHPHSVAARLRDDSQTTAFDPAKLIAESYAEVAVLFADIEEFTRVSKGASADVLMGVLNDITHRFDNDPNRPVLEKAMTIGDAYLAAIGLPDPLTDHTIQAANLALGMIEAVDRFNEHGSYQLKVSISFVTETVVAGAVGKHKKIYDL